MTTEQTWSADRVGVMEENGLWEVWLWGKKTCHKIVPFLTVVSLCNVCVTFGRCQNNWTSGCYQSPGCGTRVCMHPWLFCVPFHWVWFFLVQKCCDPFRWFDLLISLKLSEFSYCLWLSAVKGCQLVGLWYWDIGFGLLRSLIAVITTGLNYCSVASI